MPPGAPGDIEAIYGGIAGVYHLGNYLYNFLRPRLQARSLRIDDDGPSLISGTIGAADGCGMVAGTGSSLFARIAGRPLVHIGGVGYLIDTGAAVLSWVRRRFGWSSAHSTAAAIRQF